MTVAGAVTRRGFCAQSAALSRASRETLWPLIRYWARENHFPDVGRMVVIAPRDHFVSVNKMVGLDIVDVAFLSGYPT